MTMDNPTHMFILGVEGPCDPGIIGAKGANLNSLAKAGFNIPRTYFLSVGAYREFIKNNGLGKVIDGVLNNRSLSALPKSLKLREAFLNAELPADVKRVISTHSFLGGRGHRLAVRSSSNQEDLAGNSFAGLYDSYLNIQGSVELEMAIKKCWASLWSEKALVYRGRCGISNEKSEMAVIIQEMVEPVVSGVIFTADPVLLNENAMSLEYCGGLGESLVSGTTSPCRCRISRGNMNITHFDDPKGVLLSYERIKELCDTALRIEKFFSSPQDIEWAFDGDRFYILQSRPVVFAKAGNDIPDPAVWTRANVGEVFPDTVTPLTWKVFQATILNEPGLEQLGQDDDNKIEAAGIKKVRGLVYIKIHSFLDSFCYLPFVTADTLKKVLGVDQMMGGDRYKPPRGLNVKFAQTLFVLNLLGVLPRLALMCKFLRPVPKKSATDPGTLIVWNSRCFRAHLKATAYAVGAFAMIEHFLRRWKGDEADRLLPHILTGREDLQTAEQGLSLARLASDAGRSAFLRSVFMGNNASGDILKQLASVPEGQKFMVELEVFLAKNGSRAAGEFELAVSRWREDPSFVVLLLRKFMVSGGKSDPALDYRNKARQRERLVAQISSQLPFWRRWFFLRLLNSFKDFSTLRENMKYRLIEGYSALRSLYLDQAKELVGRGVLADVSDIFFLIPAEIRAAQKGKNFSSQIKERKSRHKGTMTDIPAETISRTGNSRLCGIPCSPGRVEGIARVLRDISEAGSLEPGEILVAVYTDPGWTPLFLTCKAVVTEIGGFLSHGATVAREYGIPAVTNVKGVTKMIHTGDRICVDGTSGQVMVC